MSRAKVTYYNNRKYAFVSAKSRVAVVGQCDKLIDRGYSYRDGSDCSAVNGSIDGHSAWMVKI